MSLILNDPIVGRMENKNGYWEGEWNMSPSHPVTIIAELEDKPNELPARFHNFLNSIKTKDTKFRYAAAENLLDLYNDTWKEAGKKSISKDNFAAQIKLNSVSFDETEDNVSIYYDDGDLFAGHEIKVDVSFDGTIVEANLP